MSHNELIVPVFRHGQFKGPGLSGRTYHGFVESLSERSRHYPLTQDGLEMTSATAKDMPDLHEVDTILTSTFLRTQQTAIQIAQEIRHRNGHKINIIPTTLLDTIWMPPHNLSERDFLKLEDTGRRTAIADEMFKRWSSGIGENPTMTQIRIIELFKNLHQLKEKGSHPLIVTHASFSSALQRYVRGVELTKNRNEQEILKLSGYYFLVIKDDVPRVNILKNNLLA